MTLVQLPTATAAKPVAAPPARAAASSRLTTVLAAAALLVSLVALGLVLEQRAADPAAGQHVSASPAPAAGASPAAPSLGARSGDSDVPGTYEPVRTPPSTEEQLDELHGIVQALGRTLISAEVAAEQRVRFEGNSGLAEVRGFSSGTRDYHQTVETSSGVYNMHNHANNRDTMGVGELSAVLNGAQFYSRHNDYRLLRPAENDETYGATRGIVYPDVPPSVLGAGSVNAQTAEMVEYFRAFHTQNATHRPYEQYFKPVMCYLEGAWIEAQRDIEEPFASDRHSIEANTWEELHSRIHFLLQSGRKNNLENLAQLPTAVRSMRQKEEHEVRVGSNATAVPLRPVRAVFHTLSGVNAAARTQATLPDQMVYNLLRTKEGLFIFVFIDAYDDGTDGGAVVDVQCRGAACRGATIAFADDNGEPYGSPAMENGSGTGLSWRWIGGYTDSFAYGPLTTGNYDVTFSLQGAPLTYGLDNGVSVRSPDAGAAATGPEAVAASPIVATGTVNDTVRFTGRLHRPVPVQANFEYRIACHPLGRALPTNRFRVADDLATHMAASRPLTSEQLAQTRRARFELNPRDADSWNEAPGSRELIDELMEAVPGKNNYGAVLNDTAFGDTTTVFRDGTTTLNTAYYSRYYSMLRNDAMGRSNRRRGFNDRTLWSAQTTQERVNPLGTNDGDEEHEQRWSWAVPLEIIYTTPLTKWNPYGIRYTDSTGESSVTAGGRNGGLAAGTAYNGTRRNLFFRTPANFFGTGEVTDAADTSGGVVGVLSPNGAVRQVRATGHWILFPPIRTIDGLVRQRYPIVPLHDSKSRATREVAAIKDLFFGPGADANVNAQVRLQELGDLASSASLTLTLTSALGANQHEHTVVVGPTKYAKLIRGEEVVVATEAKNNHDHSIRLRRDRDGSIYAYTLLECGGVASRCVYQGQTEHDRLVPAVAV